MERALTAMAQAPLIALAAGGTGGHLFPAEALSHALRQRGARVVVPLGRRLVTGIVVDANATLAAELTASDRIKPIAEVLDDDAFLPSAIRRDAPKASRC